MWKLYLCCRQGLLCQQMPPAFVSFRRPVKLCTVTLNVAWTYQFQWPGLNPSDTITWSLFLLGVGMGPVMGNPEVIRYFFSFEWESVSICCSGFVVFLCELLCSGTVCSVCCCFLQHRWCSILCCTMRCTAVLCTLVSCQVFHRVKRREGVRACEEVDKMWSYKVSPVTARPIPSRSAWNARSCKLHRLASSVGVTSLTDHHGWNKDAFHQIW